LDLRKTGLAGLVVALFVSFGAITAATPSRVSATPDECPTKTPDATSTPMSTATPTKTPEPTNTATPTPTSTPHEVYTNFNTASGILTMTTPEATCTPTPDGTPEEDDVMDVIVITPPNTGDAGLIGSFDSNTSLFVIAAAVAMALAGFASLRFARR
jgi:hypothetical protein